jgi:hypothetical protein
MGKLKTYDQFVNEALIDAIKNPIKWKKIKNNAKKLQKAKVAQALNNVDYAKKKEKSKGDLSAGQKEVLNQANQAKNAALADSASNISQRMDSLATTPGLKKVSSLAKVKSSMAANKIVLKAADGEESKRLKVKQKELAAKATKAQKALADYESETSKDAAEDKPKFTSADDTPAKTEKPKKDDTPAKTEKPKKDDTTEAPKADDTTEAPKDDANAKIESDIKAYNKSIEDERTAMAKATKDLDQAKRDLKTGRGSEEQVQKLQKAIEDSKEDIAELKKKEADAKKKLSAKVPESFEYVAESVSQKFARLRSNL